MMRSRQEAQSALFYDFSIEGHVPVRRQSFWVQRSPELRECLAHLVGLIMRRVGCDASGALRASFV